MKKTIPASATSVSNNSIAHSTVTSDKRLLSTGSFTGYQYGMPINEYNHSEADRMCMPRIVKSIWYA